ncbi:MAG: hypothetical protein ACFFCW_08175 [Candidatus Hodarchaeota archaeon]
MPSSEDYRKEFARLGEAVIEQHALGQIVVVIILGKKCKIKAIGHFELGIH